jgi:SAM-dependent methyltransferase
MFTEFTHIPNFSYTNGWDRYALDYEKLLVNDTVYYLTKEVMHRIVERELKGKTGELNVLDINCGTGNDFPFFFERNFKVTACDGSKGMLNKAHENYEDYIKNGRLKLLLGLSEEMTKDTFPAGQFDLIFSITGGFSYIDDKQLTKINEVLKTFLKPDGLMIVAHLNHFCLPEMLYRLLRFKNPFYRNKKQLSISIKDTPFTMYLRGGKQLKECYASSFSKIKLFPLLAATPPYQSNYRPGKKLIQFHRSLEYQLSKSSFFSGIADQIVVVVENC